MLHPSINIDGLSRVRARLGDAVVDPGLWIDVMEDICRAAGATGAGLLQADAQTADIPTTPGSQDAFSAYFQQNWHLHDVRLKRGRPIIARGAAVIVDQDIFRTQDEMKRDAQYAELLIPRGFQWFAAISFFAGSAMWGISIQRTIREGPFESNDKRALATLQQSLSEAATLSMAVGRAALSSATNALNSVRQPAIAIDRYGHVIEANDGAAALFDEDLHVRNKRLVTTDRQANAQLADFSTRMSLTPDGLPLKAEPIVVHRNGNAPVIVRVASVPPSAKSPFLGARALLTFTIVEPKPGPCVPLLVNTFALTPAEARLASLMAEGVSLEQAAEEIGIARATARNQLKAVFAKTGAHRQSELVALLARL